MCFLLVGVMRTSEVLPQWCHLEHLSSTFYQMCITNLVTHSYSGLILILNTERKLSISKLGLLMDYYYEMQVPGDVK